MKASWTRRIAGLVGGLVLAGGVTAAPASAAPLPVFYNCDSTSCVIAAGVDDLGVVFLTASNAPGNFTAEAAALINSGLAVLPGPNAIITSASIGKNGTLQQVTVIPIGEFGGVGDFASASTGGGTTRVQADYFRYNRGNGEDASAVVTATHSLTGFGGACAFDVFLGACFGAAASVGPGYYYTVVEIDPPVGGPIYVTVSWSKGHPVSVTPGLPV